MNPLNILLPLLALFVSSSVIRANPQGDWLINPAPFKAKVSVSKDGREVELNNGLLRRVIRLQPDAATVALVNLTTGESLLRGVKPEAVVEIDGRRFDIGGLKGQPNYAFLRPEWVEQLRTDPTAFRFVGYEIGKPKERMTWKRTRHHAPDVTWPPAGATLRLDFAPPTPTNGPAGLPIRVSVHYELYDGLPCYSKWITVSNGTDKVVRVDRFSSEVLAVVERASEVDELTEGLTPPNIHVETDMAFGGMVASGANRRSFRWLADPDFHTQVNYEKRTPCLLDIGPDLGPAQELLPGGVFESFRAWVLPFENTDRERCGLTIRRLYRIIAPWTTENPIMMHLVSSRGEAVTNAIDQCAAVGFEMLILSFGSGFDMENEKPATLERAKNFASYARSKGIEIGSYSLLASRSIGSGNDVVMPPGQKPAFGNSPCLESRWGTNYFRRLYEFHRESGFTLLEHDGSYPGDVCTSDQHPGHRGLEDSRWNQWREISDFYKWCRSQGFYLNVPDHYFLSGSTKSGMGYREVNWSLPREQQVIHTRQNIYDGTWQKTPSMGWMFVPLTEYQGGGAAATIEPLDQHLDHYERMIESNLALGVQACYRGPRLFDTGRTRMTVKAKVDWFKAHRDILESDLIHGRRADARELDWMLHVNPNLKEKGLLVVFNPLNEPVTKNLRVNLYYTGLTDSARIREKGGSAKRFKLSRDYSLELPVRVSAQGMNWFTVE
ncbi:MAG: alpha-galactosidase [Pedosphaera sp.]|nr:alpha-galactosidase [Pedosphaera sp.]